MSLDRRRAVPRDHPLRQMFGALTELSFEQIALRDRELIRYVADLLVDFIHVDDLYRLRDARGKRLEPLVEMLMERCEQVPGEAREARKYLGDYTLFIAGLFPESLTRRPRAASAEYYIAQGKEAYLVVADMDQAKPTASLFRKLSEQFEYCVTALNIARTVLHDPFYQYLLRQCL